MRLRVLLVGSVLAVGLLAGCSEAPAATPPAMPVLVLERDGLLPSPTGYAWEPSAAMNPLDGRNALVAVSDGEAGLSVYSTHDAGAGWARTVLPVGADAPEGSPEADWTFMGDPVAWFGPDGTAYVGGLGRTVVRAPPAPASSAEGADIFIAASQDGGRSFGPAQIVARGQGTVVSVDEPSGETLVTALADLHNLDKPWFAAGPDGRLLAVWNDLGTEAYVRGPNGVAPIAYSGNELEASWSDDGGSTWSEPTVVEANARGPVPFFTADGRMHIAYGSYADGLLRVATWSEGWSATELAKVNSQPVVAVAPDGTAHVTAMLADGAPALWWGSGATWQGPATYAEAGEGDRRANVAATGDQVWTSWYGTDDGRSHHVRVQLADGTILDATLAVGLGGTEEQYGHYSNGLAAGPNGALVAWPAIGGDQREFRFAWLRVSIGAAGADSTAP